MSSVLIIFILDERKLPNEVAAQKIYHFFIYYRLVVFPIKTDLNDLKYIWALLAPSYILQLPSHELTETIYYIYLLLSL